MSYAICNVVVGYDLDGDLLEYVDDYLSDFDFEPEKLGLVGLYSSGGPPNPMYCGVKIYEFDECTRLKTSELVLTASPEQIAEAKVLMAEFKKNVSAIMDENPEYNSFREGEEKEELLACIPENPDVYLVWSSS